MKMKIELQEIFEEAKMEYVAERKTALRKNSTSSCTKNIEARMEHVAIINSATL